MVWNKKAKHAKHVSAAKFVENEGDKNSVRCVDLRTGAFDVPPQEILTRSKLFTKQTNRAEKNSIDFFLNIHEFTNAN